MVIEWILEHLLFISPKFTHNPTDAKSTLAQVMAWCLQATSHYLSQCRPTFMTLHAISWWFHCISSANGLEISQSCPQPSRPAMVYLYYLVWFCGSARLQYLQHINSGDTAVLHKAIQNRTSDKHFIWTNDGIVYWRIYSWLSLLATNHYLNQWWHSLLMHIFITQPTGDKLLSEPMMA